MPEGKVFEGEIPATEGEDIAEVIPANSQSTVPLLSRVRIKKNTTGEYSPPLPFGGDARAVKLLFDYNGDIITDPNSSDIDDITPLADYLNELNYRLSNYYAPKNHTSSTDEYGSASSSSYGHVKLGDTITIDESTGAIMIDPTKVVFTLDPRLTGQREPFPHASDDTTYGKGDDTYYGHVKLSDNYYEVENNETAYYGVGASAYALQTAYVDLKSTLDSLLTHEEAENILVSSIDAAVGSILSTRY